MPLRDGALRLYPQWLELRRAENLKLQLQKSLHWEQSRIRIHGREIPIPRLNAWYGDPGCDYQYSGYRLPLHDWTSELLELRQQVQEETGKQFNSLLANWYRDGNDSVGWHSDDEPELGHNPVIASLSLGATRRFNLRHRTRAEETLVSLALNSGSLLLMLGSTQHFWKHCVPKTRKSTFDRINLTFRYVLPKVGKERNIKD